MLAASTSNGSCTSISHRTQQSARQYTLDSSDPTVDMGLEGPADISAKLILSMVSVIAIDGKPVIALPVPPTQSRYFRLLDLPPDIRERVYRLLPITGLGYDRCRHPTLKEFNKKHLLYAPIEVGNGKRHHIPAIATACRTTRYRAPVLYFTKKHFIFHISDSSARRLPRWLESQEDMAISSIKTFSFRSFSRHSSQSSVDNSRHWDTIHVDVRNATVRTDSSPAPCQAALDRMSKRPDFKWESYSDCDIEQVLEDMAVKFKFILEAIEPSKDGVRRIDKSGLRGMMDLAVGGSSLEGMRRNHTSL